MVSVCFLEGGSEFESLGSAGSAKGSSRGVVFFRSRFRFQAHIAPSRPPEYLFTWLAFPASCYLIASCSPINQTGHTELNEYYQQLDH
jgi:hypothetical protein